VYIQIREHCYIYDEQAQLSFLYVNTLALHRKDLKFKQKRTLYCNVIYFHTIFVMYCKFMSCILMSCNFMSGIFSQPESALLPIVTISPHSVKSIHTLILSKKNFRAHIIYECLTVCLHVKGAKWDAFFATVTRRNWDRELIGTKTVCSSDEQYS